jgi:hypothetical protein
MEGGYGAYGGAHVVEAILWDITKEMKGQVYVVRCRPSYRAIGEDLL